MTGFILLNGQDNIKKIEGWISHLCNTKTRYKVLCKNYESSHNRYYTIFREGFREPDKFCKPLSYYIDCGYKIVE